MLERLTEISFDGPRENFSKGLVQINIPELGKPQKGKVRDSWVRQDKNGQDYRIIVTTDRQSAFDKVVCTIPGKGQVLNLLSAYWFDETEDIIPNHKLALPHPNVLIAKEAKATLPIEVVVRGYLSKSSTTTSIYRNYFVEKRRNIYGIEFPEGLKPNQEFPQGTIITSTTKAQAVHDEELTDFEAQNIVDNKHGEGTWQKTKEASLALFDRASKICQEKGLILADTKYEFGTDEDGNLMLIDEIHTPDSSRFWKAESYEEKFNNGEDPETFDKEILRQYLAQLHFTGEDDKLAPKIHKVLITLMECAYKTPYETITGKELPNSEIDQQTAIKTIVLSYA